MITTNSLLNIGLNYIESSDDEDLVFCDNYVNENAKNDILTKDKLRTCVWEECYDDKSGFPYYWNIDTNEVTWQMPSEFTQWLRNRSESKINKEDNTTQESPISTSSLNIEKRKNESENNFNVNIQRKQKKRISFDVLPIRTKVLKTMINEDNGQNAENNNNVPSKNDLNLNNEQNSDDSNEKTCLSPDSNSLPEIKTDSLKDAINDNFSLIMDKINFFVNSNHSLSPIEVIKVELSTLKAAFDDNSLKEQYFYNWLSSVSDHLYELEKTAAPNGWKCHWEKEKKMYVYINLKTGETATEYPLDDKRKIKEENLGNAEIEDNEMDISDEECSLTSPSSNPNNSDIDKELELFYTDLANIEKDKEDNSTS